jgi:hypothetical protein
MIQITRVSVGRQWPPTHWATWNVEYALPNGHRRSIEVGPIQGCAMEAERLAKRQLGLTS